MSWCSFQGSFGTLTWREYRHVGSEDGALVEHVLPEVCACYLCSNVGEEGEHFPRAAGEGAGEEQGVAVGWEN